MSRLPKGFTEVEYLESSGTQYIETSIVPTPKTEFETRARIVEVKNNACFFGATSSFAWNNASNSVFALANAASSSGSIFFAYNNAGQIGTTQTVGVGTDFTAEFKNYTLKVDGTTIQTYTSIDSWTNNMPALNIFSRRLATGTEDTKGKYRIYYLKLWDNGTLVGDFIPVLDNSGVPCMYDLVNGVAYYNQGTGEFTYGHRIIPVEYLQSSGTQYIDSGVSGSVGQKMSLGIKFNNLTASEQIMGKSWWANGGMSIGYAKNASTTQFLSQAGRTLLYGGTLDTNRHDLSISIDSATSATFTVDNVSTSDTIAFTQSTGTLKLFARLGGSSGQTVDDFCSANLYYAKMYDNGVLISDFIPVRDESGVGYMFDVVSHTLYANAGTGNFLVGPDLYIESNNVLLRKKLALMLANLRKKRPYYCEVEYLESSGTQYIDTDYIPTLKTKWEFNFQYTSIGAFCANGSLANAPSTQRLVIGVEGSRKANMSFGGDNITNVTLDTNRHLFTIDCKNMSWSIDSNTGTYTTEVTDLGTNSIYFFARHRGAVAQYPCSGKLYSSRLWDNDILIRDMIPVLDWDYVPCMYDKVSGQLFYNAGTGDFTYGREIHYVDYLESTGTQYIDTGTKFDCANTTVEVKTKETSLTQVHSVCGNDGNVFYLFRGTGNWAVGYNSSAFNIQDYVVLGDNTFKIDKNLVYVNGSLVKTYTASATVSTSNTLLFNRKTSLVDGGPVTIYYCKISDNNVLVRDYIPAIDENGVGFMFDRVTHTIYDNAGTGAFKTPVVELEYLEFTGTQYIQTTFDITNATSYKYKVKFDIAGTVTNTEPRVISNEGAGSGKYYDVYYSSVADKIICRPPAAATSSIITHQKAIVFEYDDGVGKVQGYYEDDPSTLIYNQNSTFSAPTTDIDYRIGCRGNNTGSNYIWQGKIYSLYLERENMVCDFIPAYQDGVAGMYDKANNVFYTNAGTGTFGVGKIIESEYE